MKIIVGTVAVCLIIGVSIFTIKKAIEAEGRRTRNSMPGVLNNPLGDGESLMSKVDKLNASLSAINKRLIRLEDISNRRNNIANNEIRDVSNEINKNVNRMVVRINAISAEQATLKAIPSQLQTIDHNMRVILLANEEQEKQSAPKIEVIKTMEWIVQKIDDIDSYFPALYDFLGAVYTGDENSALEGYPSVDKRINEIIRQLDEIQKDVRATRNHVSPYIIEPTRRPKPFDKKE